MIEKQAEFALLSSRFIIDAHSLGYLLTYGEAWRPEIVAQMYAKLNKGITNSLHWSRLAIDLNAYFNGEWLDGKKASHIDHLTKLGELWEGMGEYCTWGGRFQRKDYNHYSYTHKGVR